MSSVYDVDPLLVEPSEELLVSPATVPKDETQNLLMQKFPVKPKEPQFKKPVSLLLYRTQQQLKANEEADLEELEQLTRVINQILNEFDRLE